MKSKTTFMIFIMCFTSQAWSKQSAHDFKVKIHGEGQPMLLIPGLSNAGEVWDDTVKKYQGQYQMHTVTLPGFAGQPPLVDKNGFLHQVRDQLLTYTKQQGWQKPVVVGHSLGGYMAMLMAIEQPNLFHKIVIVDSVPFMPALNMPTATEASIKPMADAMRKQMDNQSEEMRSASLDMILATMITDPEHIKLAKQWGMDSDPESVNQAMYELMTQDLRDEISVIKSPVLIMGSWIAYKTFGMTRERLAATYGGQYATIPNHELVITDTGKHFIMWDDPEFYFAKMDAFLTE